MADEAIRSAAPGLRIQLLFFPEHAPRWERQLLLPVGACLSDALQAAGFAEAFPELDLQQWGFGVYGKLQTLDYLLHDNDRVEIYQPLRYDPMESRRRRALHKAKAPKTARSVKVEVRS